ncbi:hypothetical protein PoB_005432800 [Plakobranchus ocellatus]|uniref:Transposase n=1 Tax=Plakobranchus ocellatus TaxID=259542 RepID=A0AAV4CA24_9GAST|nr:hypothetical protein PoB_005432800 [Plakobranchus ocellatus]
MVISGFKAVRQAGATMAGLEPATEWSLQISGRTHKPLCYRRLHIKGTNAVEKPALLLGLHGASPVESLARLYRQQWLLSDSLRIHNDAKSLTV